MEVISAVSLKNMEVLSRDAYRLGVVQDIRYDPDDWVVEGLKVKCNKDASSILRAGNAKSMILMKPHSYVMNDVMIISDNLEDSLPYISADTDTISAVSNLVDKKIVSADDIFIGTISDVFVDLDNWYVHSFRIKLDKNACDILGLKKGLFAKTISGVLTSYVRTMTEFVYLKLTADDLRDLVTLD